MNVRRAELSDAAIIASFNQAMALETENKALPDEQINAGVMAQISNPAHGYYLVVENDLHEVIGCLGITFEWSDWRNGQFLWIQSVFIAPAGRRQGAFSALYNHVIQAAKKDPEICGVRLYVEQENDSARSTYLALGMAKTHYDLLEIEV
ncbi:MAG: ribosomal protein S18 acetylase RimI-like enzyme [Candidatus Azotimanducaceae bacterium]|jgi:ribosomal protein S18 acetylase RimI-like enzyme